MKPLFSKIGVCLLIAGILCLCLMKMTSNRPLFTIGGISLEMTREEVHRKLGSPKYSLHRSEEEGGDISSEGFKGITVHYENGLVERVAGTMLEVRSQRFESASAARSWLIENFRNDSMFGGKVFEHKDHLRRTRLLIDYGDSIVLDRIEFREAIQATR